MARKRGNPESAPGPVPTFKIPRGGDYLDNYEGGAAKRFAPPEPEPTPEPAVQEQRQPDQEAVQAVPVELEPPAPPKPEKKRSTKKASASKQRQQQKKKRPPRADIGFRQDLEEAALKLQKHVVLQSHEPNTNRTDVIAQATCAVARALEDIDCKKVPRRGHFGSASARIYDAALQEALYRGVAHHYIKNNVRHLPDHLLELCYNEYRRQNALDDDGGS